jgi:hypothetical protein
MKWIGNLWSFWFTGGPIRNYQDELGTTLDEKMTIAVASDVASIYAAIRQPRCRLLLPRKFPGIRG